MNNFLQETITFFKEDYQSYPLRWTIEAFAWIGTLLNTIVINLTVPDVPWLFCYPIWITGCLAYAWAQWTRKSSLGVLSSILFAAIDGVGLIKVLGT
jgi:hypothetical protein